jgi:hypothetical protein
MYEFILGILANSEVIQDLVKSWMEGLLFDSCKELIGVTQEGFNRILPWQEAIVMESSNRSNIEAQRHYELDTDDSATTQHYST